MIENMASYEPVQLAFNSVEPDCCAKDKAPILFLHGMTECKEQWRDIPEIIAKTTKRKAYAVDSRNHGDSPWSDVFNFDCNADDLLSFMDCIGAPKATIVGHSMGGLTGMKVALRAPERVEKLVVEDMICRKIPQPLIDIRLNYMMLEQAALERLPGDVDEDTAKRMIIHGLIQGLPEEISGLLKPENAKFRLRLKRTPEGRWAFKSNFSVMMKALRKPEELMTEPTGVYDGPVCFIYGKLSPILVSLEEEHNRKYFPNLKMVGIDNATHSAHSDCPRDFTSALLNFLHTEE